MKHGLESVKGSAAKGLGVPVGVILSVCRPWEKILDEIIYGCHVVAL
jgi:hypothetical protein